ncbi:MAG: M18 family aminopeptidase [Bacilli bacterium]|nr:M18 family aminopeptidase [Bacilli bacterium]
MEKYVNELLNFIESSPTVYHNIHLIKAILNNFKYTELKENTKWNLEPNKAYYVIRDGASIITFKTPADIKGFHIVASHNDSPSFKVKPNGELNAGAFKKLNTEPYGGMIATTWFDRPLSVAGRVIVKTPNGVETRLVNLAGHNVVIPSVAIHLRGGQQMDINLQNDLLPVVGLINEENTFTKQLEKCTIFSDDEKILSHDLFLYNKEKGCVAGLDNELIMSPKLDDLECVFASLEAFLEAKPSNKIMVCAVFNNEEVGSGSNNGAGSTFLTDTLERICSALDLDKYMMYANSFLVSADNAHAVHPAHPEKSDPTNNVQMNKGIVIKHHSSLSYTTSGLSASAFKAICDKAGVPYQDYTNRSDLRGGSTLGRIALEKLSINALDIGLAQLAMHSIMETAGSKDIKYMVSALKEFYQIDLEIDGVNINIK